MDTLEFILGTGEAKAEATVDGKTMRVEQYIYPHPPQPFWLFAQEVCTFDITFDREILEKELAGEGFDPDALIWRRT